MSVCMPYSLAFFYLVVEPLLLFVLLPVWLMPTSPPLVLEGRQKAFFFFSCSAESGFCFARESRSEAVFLFATQCMSTNSVSAGESSPAP